jgi:glutaminase
MTQIDSQPETDVNTQVFRALDRDSTGAIRVGDLLRALEDSGVNPDDPRLKQLLRLLPSKDKHTALDQDTFSKLILPNAPFILRASQGDLVCSDFAGFEKDLNQIYDQARGESGGQVADYIPQLARVNPDLFGVSACTIDGQRINIGDYQEEFCVQSTCKPINYCLALEEIGRSNVHKHIGHEPSGSAFNEVTFNAQGLPHNPMINAGGIMSCSLIQSHLPLSDRFDHVLDFWKRASAYKSTGFNNAVYLSERATADRNFALGYLMREHGAFPKGTNLKETLEFYFMCCSITVTAESMAILAATLANAGVNPLTGETLLEPETVKSCLSLMSSCGMYDYSGTWAFTVGIPAKSGVSGVILAVIPNFMGLCLWSPPLDHHGNSVRGIRFSELLSQRFNFHNFDSLVTPVTHKRDPRKHRYEASVDTVLHLIWAAARGDLSDVRQLLAAGVDVNVSDYDHRTALHLAAVEGRAEMVRYLLDHGAIPDVFDRWSQTPLDEAKRAGHQTIVTMLEETQPT